MKTCWFIVIRTPSAWWVDCEGKAYGPFSSRKEAAENAVQLAKAFGDPGRRSDVYIPDDDGMQVLAWSAGRTVPGSGT